MDREPDAEEEKACVDWRRALHTICNDIADLAFSELYKTCPRLSVVAIDTRPEASDCSGLQQNVQLFPRSPR